VLLVSHCKGRGQHICITGLHPQGNHQTPPHRDNIMEAVQRFKTVYGKK